MTESNPSQIVFIDPSVPDIDDLLAGLQPGEQAFVLDPGSDGLQQIADILAADNLGSLSAISIVSHGESGELILGSSPITDGNLADNAGALAEIGAALAPGGKIQLYGCEVALGATGQQFIDDFSTLAGGAEVAAATHLVGSAALGGSWMLDAVAGAQSPGPSPTGGSMHTTSAAGSGGSNAAAPFTANAESDFNGVLDGGSDPELWIGVIGPGEIVHVDDTGGATAVNAATLYSGNTSLVDPADIVIDPTDGLYFVLEQTPGHGFEILEASLGAALTNPTAAPVFSLVFDDTSATDVVPEIALDTISHQLYFVDINETTSSKEISRFERLNYSSSALTTSATPTVLNTVGPVQSAGVAGFTLDLANNRAFFALNAGGFEGAGTPNHPIPSSTTVPASGFLYEATGLTPGASSVTMSALTINGAATLATSLGFFASFGGIAYDTKNGEIYFTLQQGSGATEGGVYAYTPTAGLNGTLSTIWEQTAGTSPKAGVDLNSLVIDPTTGNWYAATDASGTNDDAIWRGSLIGGAPVEFLAFPNTGDPSANEMVIDQQPTLSITSANATFTESALNPASAHNTPVALITGATATDPDNAELAGATIAITSGFFAGDVLAANLSGTSISQTYNGTVGVLTLSGADSFADYQTALQNVSFSSTSDNPTNFGADNSRVLSWTVSDGLINSTVQTVNVAVIGVNDPPTLAGTAASVGFTEGGAAVALSPAVTVSDPDDQKLSNATVAITAGGFTGDVLAVAAGGLTGTSITATYNGGTETLTLNGADTLADYQAVLDKVTFVTASNNPTDFGADPTRTVSWTLIDPSGTTSGGQNTTTVTTSIAITAINNPPTLAGTAASAGFTEGGAAVTLSPAVTVSDPDDLDLSSATVKITAGGFTGDVLAVSAAALTGTSITATYASGTETLTLNGTDTLADYQAALDAVTFVTASNNPTDFGADPTRSVAWILMDPSGTTSGGLNTTTVTTSIAITAINNPPTLTGTAASVGFTEGGTAVTLSPAVTVSDPDDQKLSNATVAITAGGFTGDVLAVAAGGLTGTSITATYNSGTETLTLNGADTLADYQAVLDKVTFVTASNNPTDFGADPTRSVTWILMDPSGTTSGGQNTTTVTTSIAITAINNPPTLAGTVASVGFTEGGAAVTLSPSVSISDPDDLDLSSATVKITAGGFTGDVLAVSAAALTGTSITATYSSGTETLTLNGTDTLADYQAALDAVTFVTASNNPTDFGADPTRTVSWTLMDPSGTTSGGQNTSAPILTSIAVTAINNPPTLAGVPSVATTGPGPTATLAPNVTVSDPDNLDLASATVSIAGGSSKDLLAAASDGTIAVTYNAATETLTLSGSDTLGDYQTALDSIVFDTTGPGGVRILSWELNDGSASNNLSVVQTETLTAFGQANWIGGNGDWDTPVDWSTGAVPNAFDDVAIATAGTFAVTHSGGTSETIASLQIGSNDVLAFASGSLSVSGGVSNSNVIDFDTTGSGGGSMIVGGTIVNGGRIVIGNSGITAPVTVSAAALVNSGTIVLAGDAVAEFVIAGSATDSGAITLTGSSLFDVNGDLVVSSGGSLTVSTGGTVVTTAGVVAGGAVTNLGTVIGSGSTGIVLSGGADLVNGGSGGGGPALVEGTIGVAALDGPVTATNYGTIASTSGSAGIAVSFTSASDLLVLEGGSTLVGSALGGGGTLDLDSLGGAGTIAGLGSQYSGFAQYNVLAGAAWTLSGGNTVGAGVALVDFGTLTNAGTLVATAGGLIVDPIALPVATLVNSGVISGTVTLGTNSYFENLSGTTLTGAGNGVYVSGSSASTYVRNAGNILVGGYGIVGAYTTVNSGTISSLNGAKLGIELNGGGSVTNESQGYILGGVYVNGGGVRTVVNAGTIAAPTSPGVFVAFGYVDNQSGGIISGAVGVSVNAGTLVDAGTIIGSGGTAVYFGNAGNDLLVLQNGYKMIGAVAGSSSAGASNTLELAGTIGNAVTASYNGLALSNFQDVLFGPGGAATLDIANTTSPVSVTLSGFTATTDLIDLTAIGTNGTIANINTVTNTVTILGSLGSVALQFSGANLGRLTASSDGGSGTDLRLVAPPDDFAGNGVSNILWQNNSGLVALWGMNGSAVTSSQAVMFQGNVDMPGPEWSIVGTGDFTGDSKSDILWRNSSDNTLALWTMNGATVTASQFVTAQGSPITPNATWSVVGTGQFSGAGSPADVLWRNTDGEVALWTMSGATVASSLDVTAGGIPDMPDATWSVAGTGDFTGNGTTDVLWRDTSGLLALWTMNGTTVVASQAVEAAGAPDEPDATWSIAGIGDFNGDGVSDILWRHSGDGLLAMWTMNGPTVASSQIVTFQGGADTPDATWSVAGIGDYTGTGTSDVLWRNTSGALVEWTMNGSVVTSSQLVTEQGVPNAPDGTWHVKT